MFNGTETEIGEMHCAFLQKWYQLKCGADSRKASKCAFPGLGDAVVNSAISKVSAVKAFVYRKQRSSKTGERLASWTKKFFCFGACRRKKGCLVEKAEKIEKPSERPARSHATGQQVKKTCNPKMQPVMEGKPFFWVCEMHQGYQQVLHPVQENHL